MQQKQSGMTPSGAMEFNCAVPFSVPSTCKNCSLLMRQQWHNRQLKPLTINSRVWRTDKRPHMQHGHYCLVERVQRNNSELTATKYPTSNPVPSPFLNRGKTAMDSLTFTSWLLHFRILRILHVSIHTQSWNTNLSQNRRCSDTAFK